MKKKKHDLNYHTRKSVFSVYWIQIASLLTFYMIYFLIKCVVEHETFVVQLILSILTEITICYMGYQKAWKVGDYHAGEVLTGAEPLKKKRGILLGVLTVAPIIACAILCSLVRIIDLEFGLFDTILSLFVYRWSGVVEYISMWTDGSDVIGIIFYVCACIPLVVSGIFGYRNGFIGIYEGIRFKKRHCERYENEGARELWEKA